MAISRSETEQTLLLDVALAMMYADGSADPSEIAALQEIASGTPYFAVIDAESIIRESGQRAAELQRLLTAGGTELARYAEHPARRRRLFEVLLIVMRADGQVAQGELTFLQAVLRAVSMSEADLVRVLPDAASVLFGAASQVWSSGGITHEWNGSG